MMNFLGCLVKNKMTRILSKKKLWAGSLFLLGVLAGQLICHSQSTISVNRPISYNEQQGYLRRLDANSDPKRLLFLGSSTIAGLDVSAVTSNGLNLGLGGDTVASLTERLQNYRSVPLAKAIIVNIGLNDILNDCNLPTKDDIEKLLKVIPGNIPTIFIGVQGVAPKIRGQRCAGTLIHLVDQFNLQIAKSCNTMNICIYVENPVPANVDQALSDLLHEKDGIHLSEKGYELLKGRLRNALAGFTDSHFQE